MRKFKIPKKIACFLLIVISMMSLFPIETRADEFWPEGPVIDAPSAIVIEQNTGVILYDKNSDQVNYPASITKVMTVLLALENCDLDEIVTFSADAVFKNEGNTSHIARDLNEKMTMEECLYAVMLESANECAYAVAEHVGEKLGGDYQTFIDLMNQRAKELGCTNTHFANANGLPDEDHWTSAKDMALIAAEAYKNESYRIIIGSRRYVIPPTNKHKENTYLNNHHCMIHNFKTAEYLYEYCTGGKTGYTVAAGSTLVSYAEKDGISLVCVIMKANGTQHYVNTRILFEYCFQNFVTYNIVEHDNSLTESIKNKGFMNNFGSYVKIENDSTIVLPATASFSDANCTIKKNETDSKNVAYLEYTYGDRIVGIADIITSGVFVEETYFDKNSSIIDPEKDTIRVKPIYIVLVVLAIIALVMMILLGKRFYDNYYVILHNVDVWKQRKQRFRPIEKKRRKRKRRDRMFR